METTQSRQPVPRVKMDDVKAKVVDIEYIYRHDRVTTCILKMENGAYIEGTSFTIDAAYNVKELGEQAAYQKALGKAYEMENYLQLQRYHDMRQIPALPERDMSKPAEQQGLFQKFHVSRVDGSDQPGDKHDGCRYFVLDLDHDQYAPATMREYADLCQPTHPKLAASIRATFPKGPGPLDAIHATEEADRRCLTGSATIKYEPVFNEEALDNMVNRFLGWKLPETFYPDCFISFDRERANTHNSWPIGTNLFDAEQARAMFRHCVQVVPSRLGSISEPTLTAGPAISTENLVHDGKEPV